MIRTCFRVVSCFKFTNLFFMTNYYKKQKKRLNTLWFCREWSREELKTLVDVLNDDALKLKSLNYVFMTKSLAIAAPSYCNYRYNNRCCGWKHRLYIKDQRQRQQHQLYMQKCLKPAFLLTARRGQLLWLQKSLCRSLKENCPWMPRCMT